jgi:hypothetical protein
MTSLVLLVAIALMAAERLGLLQVRPAIESPLLSVLGPGG